METYHRFKKRINAVRKQYMVLSAEVLQRNVIIGYSNLHSPLWQPMRSISLATRLGSRPVLAMYLRKRHYIQITLASCHSSKSQKAYPFEA